jgi:hypothetical protein
MQVNNDFLQEMQKQFNLVEHKKDNFKSWFLHFTQKNPVFKEHIEKGLIDEKVVAHVMSAKMASEATYLAIDALYKSNTHYFVQFHYQLSDYIKSIQYNIDSSFATKPELKTHYTNQLAQFEHLKLDNNITLEYSFSLLKHSMLVGYKKHSIELTELDNFIRLITKEQAKEQTRLQLQLVNSTFNWEQIIDNFVDELLLQPISNLTPFVLNEENLLNTLKFVQHVTLNDKKYSVPNFSQYIDSLLKAI